MKQCFPLTNSNHQIVGDQVNELIQQLEDLPGKVYTSYESGNFHLGIDDVMAVLRKCNKFFFDQEPWRLVKQPTADNQAKLEYILYLTYETLRIAAILLSPIIPNCTEIVLDKLNIPTDERYWADCRLKMYENDDQDRTFSQERLIVYQKVL